MKKDAFQQMLDKWPSGIVARTEAERFTGGMVSGKYLANLDSLGLGPARVVVGRKVGYPVEDFVLWLRGRASRS